MNQPVAIGGDGREPGDEDGPLLAALKKWGAGMHAQYRATLDQMILLARQERYLAAPNGVPLQAAGIVPASGTLVLDLGAPQLGRRWLVRRLAVAGVPTVGTTLTGRADWYVGQPSSPVPGSWQWAMATLPSVQPFSSESIPVIPSDHLFVVITSGTSGQGAVASATVLDYATEPSAGPAVQVI